MQLISLLSPKSINSTEVATPPKDIPADDKESRDEDLSQVINSRVCKLIMTVFVTFTFAISGCNSKYIVRVVIFCTLCIYHVF